MKVIVYHENQADALEPAAQRLKQGELVAFPTETVYGLGANALDPAAVAKIFEAKGRPATNPLIVHVADVQNARQLARVWSPLAERLANAFWPGPLTLIVPKSPDVPDVVTAGLDSVALRVPSHPVAIELMRRSGCPLAAPSANTYTEISPTTADHVQRSLGERIGMIVDGGSTHVGLESTVVSLVNEPVVVRPGMITVAQLQTIEPTIRSIDLRVDDGPALSPGLARKHYAPRVPTILWKGEQLEENDVLVGFSEYEGAGTRVALPRDVEGYAKGFYDALYKAQALSKGRIFIEAPPQTAEWAAVWNRLERSIQ